MDDSTTTTYGYCHCGCGERTPLASQTNVSKGWVRGEPIRFVNRHHTRQKRGPRGFMPRRHRFTTPDRFWAKVEMAGADDCWIWTGTSVAGGYGRFRLPGRYSGRVPAHRFAYELLVGPVPDELVIDHLCRNPACVNPRHLEPVTTRENCLRGLAGVLRVPKTHCKHGHEFTPENTYLSARGYRGCRRCTFERRARARAGSEHV